MKHLVCPEAENGPQDKGKRRKELRQNSNLSKESFLALTHESAFSAAGAAGQVESYYWWFSGDTEALLLLEVGGGLWSVGVGLRQASAVFIQHSRESKVPQKYMVLMVLR